MAMRTHNGDEVFARALHLANSGNGAARISHGVRQVTYYHMMFDRHQIVFGDGLASESFYPGTHALATLARSARDSLQQVFNSLAEYGPAARQIDRITSRDYADLWARGEADLLGLKAAA